MTELRITTEIPSYAKISNDVFLLLLDGKLRSRTETLKYLKPLAPPPPPPPPPPPVKRGRAAKAAAIAAAEAAAKPIGKAREGKVAEPGSCGCASCSGQGEGSGCQADGSSQNRETSGGVQPKQAGKFPRRSSQARENETAKAKKPAAKAKPKPKASKKKK